MSPVLIVAEFLRCFSLISIPWGNSSKYYQFHRQASSYSLLLVWSRPVLQKSAPALIEMKSEMCTFEECYSLNWALNHT